MWNVQTLPTSSTLPPPWGKYSCWKKNQVGLSCNLKDKVNLIHRHLLFEIFFLKRPRLSPHMYLWRYKLMYTKCIIIRSFIWMFDNSDFSSGKVISGCGWNIHTKTWGEYKKCVYIKVVHVYLHARILFSITNTFSRVRPSNWNCVSLGLDIHTTLLQWRIDPTVKPKSNNPWAGVTV